MSAGDCQSLSDAGAVREMLRSVTDPCSIATGVPIDIVDMGIVRDIRVFAGHIQIVLRLTNPFCFQAGLISQAIERKVGQTMEMPVKVEIDPTDDWTPERMAAAARSRLRKLRPLPAPGSRAGTQAA